jgi:hypothetical protein
MVYGTAFTRCRSRPNEPEPEPPPATLQRRDPPVQVQAPQAQPRWWCVTYGQGQLGACYRNPSMCESRRSSSLTVDPDTSPCVLRGPASCFGIAFAGQEGSDDSCHPSFAACNDQRDYVLAHPERATALTMCRSID